MAGVEHNVSDDSDSGLVNSSDKRKDNIPSSYFITELNISKKNSDNHKKNSGRYFNDEPCTSTGRKVFVNVSDHGIEKKMEIAVTSSFSSRKKVDNSTQSDRNIVGQEESPPKERRKWVRPPVVGQASNVDLPPINVGLQQTSSDSEIERKKPPKLHLSLGKTTSYFDNISQKVTYNIDKELLDCHKDEIPSTPDNIECQRIPSPASASSLTSRPLEWDSGADVGYNNIFTNDSNDQRLSTLEKLALAQGTANIFKRSDPEGTTGNTNLNPNPMIKIAPPVAESTPKSVDQSKNDSDNEMQRRSKSKKERNARPLSPEIIVKHIVVPSPSDGSLSPEIQSRLDYKNNDQKYFDSLKKLSSSLEEMTLKNNNEQGNTFPRSHSQNNIVEENNAKPTSQRFDSAKSRSSSSVSTVVNKRSSSQNTGHIKGKIYEGCSRDSDDNPNDVNPIHSNQQIETISRHPSPQGTDQFNTLESGHLTGEARVNSFEYLPGHVYENSVAKIDSDSSSQQSDGVWDATGDNSKLKDDVERGANLMAEFIRSSKAGEDQALKKQLMRRVVERLINSGYHDEEILKPLRVIGRGNNMMIETRGQISGESSTEKSDANLNAQDNPCKANKCVGTGISTSLSGYTETSEWNSATESSKKYTSDGLDSNYSARAHVMVNKKTQVSAINDEGSGVSHQPEKRESSKHKDGIKFKRKGEAEMHQYLQRERKNQLNWIKSEIDHLSNLKKLLEKHELLKKNLDHIKKTRKCLEDPLKNYSENIERKQKNKSKRIQMESKSAPAFSKTGQFTDSGSSGRKDAGWTSHHYETEDEIRKRKENIEPKLSSLRYKPSKCITDPLPRSTSYMITFPNKSDSDFKRKMSEDDDIMLTVGELKTAIDEIVERHKKPIVIPNIHQPSLKESLESGRPDYLRKAESRRQILSELMQLRHQRQENKKDVLAAAHADIPGPPHPLSVKRVLSQKNLRKQTEKKYKQLAEVKNKKAELKRKEEYRTNRLMAEVFNKKLQRRALQGQVNLSNSVCVTDPPK